MAEHIKKCNACGKYTLENKCPSCSSETGLPKPPKFSPDDKYSSYRRIVRKKEMEKKGLY